MPSIEEIQCSNLGEKLSPLNTLLWCQLRCTVAPFFGGASTIELHGDRRLGKFGTPASWASENCVIHHFPLDGFAHSILDLLNPSRISLIRCFVQFGSAQIQSKTHKVQNLTRMNARRKSGSHIREQTLIPQEDDILPQDELGMPSHERGSNQAYL